MADENARLTPLGKILSLLLILALVAIGGYIVVNKSSMFGGKSNPPAGPEPTKAEEPDTTGVLTQKTYQFVPAQKLAPVKGASAYEWDNDKKILRFSYNVWAGWLPVFAANHGAKANDESVFWKKYGFRVEMVLQDDPTIARDAFAAGRLHTLWGTADMMVLFAPELARDSRTALRIVQQIDWSNGGDGIVVRNNVRNVADLKGKTITLAQNSPSEYYLTSLLLSAGLRPSDVTVKPTATAFEAAAAFVADKSIDACVSWAPDIYNIADRVPGTKLLSTTAQANKLIADVYAFRADFVRDHPEVVQGLIAGIFDGMDMVENDPAPACKWMADAFSMQPEDVMKMRSDAHPTNFAENVQFFLNASNPVNFERTWKNAAYVYRTLGRIEPTSFDQVMDFSFLQQLEKAGTFAHQTDKNVASFQPGRTIASGSTAEKIITQTIRISFYPNSSNPFELARDELGVQIPGKMYDPSATATIDRVGTLVGQFDRAMVLIQGFTDSSMKGRVPVQAVKDLSLARAQAIKQALVEKFKFDPNKFTIEGKGWDEPFDANDPNNHALNRRVEISVLPPEQQ